MHSDALATPAGAADSFTETSFQVHGLTLWAKVWGAPDGIPTLALHGWLDNANTFDRLAPGLPELRLVALDLAGHGRSSHRPPGAHYESALYIQDVLAVANALGWDRFNLIGHSMGASICSQIAGLFPERVARVVLIDGCVTPDSDPARNFAERRQSILQMLQADEKQPPVYASLEEMVTRVTQATDQSRDAAGILVARGHKTVPGGFTWRTDPRIRFRSPHATSQAEVDLLMQHSQGPALLIQADAGDKWYWEAIPGYLAQHPDLRLVTLPGPHHIHLEAQAPQVLALVREFLQLG